MINTAGPRNDAGIYLLAVLLGCGAAWIDVKLGDLLVTAVMVLASTMLLGILRPARPWRWVLIVAVCVPIGQFLAFRFLTQRPARAQIYESFLGFLTGTAGAYAGSAGRKAAKELFPG